MMRRFTYVQQGRVSLSASALSDCAYASHRGLELDDVPKRRPTAFVIHRCQVWPDWLSVPDPTPADVLGERSPSECCVCFEAVTPPR